MFNTSWDIDKYKDPLEYDLHWNLRKSFMKTHKKKYAERRLVCLAKVFMNIELMGCMYNPELMFLVQNLAKQVEAVVKYREQKKCKIRRTFVKASDAVKKDIVENDTEKKQDNAVQIPLSGSYNKRHLLCPRKMEQSSQLENKMKQCAEVSEPPTKKFKLNNTKRILTTSRRLIDNEEVWNYYNKVRLQEGIGGKLVLYESKSDPFQILQESVSKSKLKFQYVTDNDNDTQLKTHKILIDDEIIAKTCKTKENLKGESKIALTQTALDELRKYCFTVIPSVESEKVERQDTSQKIIENTCDPTAMHGGIGAKIMKLMGWSGKGLGKDETGIEAPIEVADTKYMSKPKNMQQFQAEMKAFLDNYIKSSDNKPLQLSETFTKDEREVIHKLANTLPIKTKSYGKGNKRFLRIEKTHNIWDLVQELLNNDGSMNNIKLIRPSAIVENKPH